MFGVCYVSQGTHQVFHSIPAQTVQLLWGWDMPATLWHDKIQDSLDRNSVVSCWAPCIQTLILELFCLSQKMLIHCHEQKKRMLANLLV